MKQFDTLIEIIDDQKVRIYSDNSVHIVEDRDIESHVGNRIALTDPVHVFHQRLSLVLQKKQLNANVMASLVEDSVTNSTEDLVFSGRVQPPYTDIIWLSKSRLDALNFRFKQLKKRSIQIVPASLAMVSLEQQPNQVQLIRNSPWNYIISHTDEEFESFTLSDDVLAMWTQSFNAPINTQEMPEVSVLLSGLNILPRIAMRAESAASSPSEEISWGKRWLGASLMLLAISLLWGVNLILDIRFYGAQLSEVKTAQAQLFTRIFPNATNQSDPYGRFVSEVERLSGIRFIDTVNTLLAEQNAIFTQVKADLSAMQFIVTLANGATLDTQPFIEAGINVAQNGKIITLTEGRSE